MSTPEGIHNRPLTITMLLVLSAAILAFGVTYKTSRWCFPSRLSAGRSDRVPYGTMHLTELIDKKHRLYFVEDTRDPGFLGVPDDYDNDERVRLFCRRVHEQALKYRRSNAAYDVWSVEFGRGPCGWPFIVNAGYHLVDITQKGPDGKIHSDEFWLDDLGNQPIRLGGWIGNWLIFLVATLLMLETGYRAVRALKRRLMKSPAGLCPNCGYNLSGNVSGICSECGQFIRAEQG